MFSQLSHIISRFSCSLLLWTVANGFNIETRNVTLFKGDIKSYFGYTVALQEYWDSGSLLKKILIGGPKSNTSQPGVTSGGAVYSCDVTIDQNPGPCTQIPFDREGPSEYENKIIEQKSGQWFGASLDVEQDKVLACAPRYLYFSKFANKREAIGTCYLGSVKENTFTKYSPNKHSVDEAGDYEWEDLRDNYRGLSQIGFSADLYRGGDWLMLSGPGTFWWQGQLYSQRDDPNNADIRWTREKGTAHDGSYLGYSFAIGNIGLYGREGYVVGVPKSDYLKGRIDVFGEDTDASRFRDLKYSLKGEQLGEYFGYALAVDDLNGDGRDDIVVSAPFHNFDLDTSFESGRVVIFYKDDRHGYNSEHCGTPNYMICSTQLNGNKKSGARFGTAVAAMKDIDNDGYNDLAVGAPFDGEEGAGAVYIYRGGPDTIVSEFSQVVYASSFRSLFTLSTFGHALAAGKDMDSNLYPDLVVGAYGSDSAVFLRTRPIVTVEINFSVESEDIDILSECTIKIPSLTKTPSCIVMVLDVSYSGKNAPAEINLLLDWKIDTLKFPRRVYFNQPNKPSEKTQTMILKKSEGIYNQRIPAYLQDNNLDQTTPIKLELEYNLLEGELKDMDQLSPLLPSKISRKHSKQVQIDKNCGSDFICSPNLSINGSWITSHYILGSVAEISLDIEVRNAAENAFEAKVTAELPPGVQLKQVIPDESLSNHVVQCNVERNELGLSVTVCDVGNPLQNQEQVHFQLKFLANGLMLNGTEMDFTVKTKSVDNKNEDDLDDNTIETHLPLSAALDIIASGVPTPAEQVLFNFTNVIENSEDNDINVTHQYQVKNLGPSSSSLTQLKIGWPRKFMNGKEILYISNHMFIKQSEGRGKCERIPDIEETHGRQRRDANKLKEEPRPEMRQAAEVDVEDKMVNMTCDDGTVECTYLMCDLYDMSANDVIILTVTATVHLDTIVPLGITHLLLASTATASVIRVPYDVSPTTMATDTVTVESSVISRGVGAEKKIPLWIIVASSCGGVLLLVIIIIILWRCGFFKRLKPEDMEDEMVREDECVEKDEDGEDKDDTKINT